MQNSISRVLLMKQHLDNPYVSKCVHIIIQGAKNGGVDAGQVPFMM